MRITPGATQLVDVSTRQLHGEIVRGTSERTSVPGKIGAGLRLGGPTTRSYAFVPEFPLAPVAITVCAWVRAESRPRWARRARSRVKLNAGGREPETNTPGFWDGTLDELAVFHRALSPAQILDLFEAVR